MFLFQDFKHIQALTVSSLRFDLFSVIKRPDSENNSSEGTLVGWIVKKSFAIFDNTGNSFWFPFHQATTSGKSHFKPS